MSNLLILAVSLLAPSLVPLPASIQRTDGCWRTDAREMTAALFTPVADASVPKEGYRLSITPDGGIDVRCSDGAGAFYALQTLRQLAEPEAGGLAFPCCEIADAPRFGWRGVQLDEARHFFGKAAVKRLLDLMAAHKLNVLHWHLTDNQGWRLPVRKHPRLVSVGAVRPVSPNRRDLADLSEEGVYGPSSYTREEIAEIIDYAAARFIRVVPEVDLPGHCAALLRAYPDCGCFADNPSAAPTNAVANVVCAGDDRVLALARDIFDEVAEIFPDPVVHIGGDEVKKVNWRACPKCQARMREKGLRTESDLQAWFAGEIAAHLAKKGKRVIGWDEIVLDGAAPDGCLVMSWRGAEGGRAAAAAGHEAVMCPHTSCYFDYTQCLADDPAVYPWFTCELPLEKAYAYDPLDGIPEDRQKWIIGGQCCNWTEFTCTEPELQWKMWPRTCATAEVFWSPAATRDFADFRRRMETHRRRLIAQGVNCASLGQGAWERAETRARELCAQMTLEEKAGELMVYDYRFFGDDPWGAYTNLVNRGEIGALMRVQSPALTRRLQDYKLAHSRLKIPLIIHEDITHGWVTTLPLQLAMACSWDDAAVEKGEAVAARESAAIGINLTYSPQVEVSDDPRWGRIGATLGEDPYLSGRMAAARVRGDQGRTEANLADGEHVVSCVKHFIGYSSLQGGKDYRHMDFSRRELLETHLPPHRAALDAGALAVMNAYTAFDGVPCNFSKYLLTDLLRNELGFKGQLITDWTTLQFSIDEGAATDLADAAKRGLEAGVDMDMISRAFLELPRLVREGQVDEAALDAAVVRSLALKFLTGLFDDPYKYCDEEKAKKELFSERNKRDVLELTRESIVLLKNAGGILPLSTNRVVGLTGTWMDDEDVMRGGMGKDLFDGGDDAKVDGGDADPTVDTLKVAMSRRWGDKLDARPIDFKRIARGEATLPGDDVVVLAIGEPTGYTGERRGRARITLPESELENLRALKRGGKKIVSVVFAGRPFIMNEIVWLSDAVVLAWYPGAMGGEALAEILAGETNPSGKLAQSIPLDVGQIPLSYREKRTFIACGYADIPAQPLFPFGFGLSYTTFAYGKPEVAQPVFDIGETVEVAVKVTNTGTVAGREVVQLYLRDEVASVLPRERELREFTSIWLSPGETKTVTFALPPEAFALYGADLKRVVEPGDFTVFVGPDSTTANAVRLTLKTR